MLNKILIVLPNDSEGGAEKVLKMIAAHFICETNVSIYFLQKKSTNFWDELQSSKNIKLNYGKSKSRILGLISLMFFAIRSRKYDYVFSSHTLINGYLGLLIKLNLIEPNFFVARESTTIFSRFSGLKLFKYRVMYCLGYSSIDLLICQTELMKDQFINNLPSISKKLNVMTIPNPIKIENTLRPPSSFVFDEHYIVAAGRLIEEKGFDILIDAFDLIKGDYSSLKLIILGEGHLREKLETKIKNLCLKDRVILAGHVSNPLNYFKHSKACVVSSRVEGFPNVLLEMMSQNTNVISTRCAGDIHKLEGVALVNVNDVYGLAECINFILDTDTKHNRVLFDNELKSRSINNFINKIEFFLSEN